MPYYVYDDDSAIADVAVGVAGAAVAATAALAIGAILLPFKIAQMNEEERAAEAAAEAERKRKEELVKRFGDKKAGIIAAADYELSQLSDDNIIEIQKLKENSKSIGTTYSSFTFKVPKFVYKISNPILSNSFNIVKEMRLNINGQMMFDLKLNNDDDFIQALRLTIYEVKEGDIVTLEIETYNNHDEIKDFGLYLLKKRGKKFIDNCQDGVDIWNPIYVQYTCLSKTADYGTFDFVLISRINKEITKVDVTIEYSLNGVTKKIPITISSSIKESGILYESVILEELKDVDSVFVYPTGIILKDGTFMLVDEKKQKIIHPELPEKIDYPEDFVSFYSKSIGSEKLLKYFYDKKNWGYCCPVCGSAVAEDDKYCIGCGTKREVLEKANKKDVIESFDSWSKEQNRLKKLQEEEEDRLKREKEAKRKIKITIASIFSIIILFICLLSYRFVLKPYLEKKTAIENYDNATYEEKVALYPSMLKYGFVVPTAFFFDGDECISSSSFLPGEDVVFPSISNDKNDQWKIIGWTTLSNDKEIVSKYVMPLEDISFKAVYGQTITYLDADGTLLKEETFKKSDSLVQLSSSIMTGLVDGFENISWKDENGNIYNLNSDINNPKTKLTLTAVYSIPVTVFDVYGNVVESKKVDYNDIFSVLEWDEKVGYIGWSYKDQKDIINTVREITVLRKTDIILRSKYHVIFNNIQKNEKNSVEFVLDKGFKIDGSFLEDIPGYFGIGYKDGDHIYLKDSVVKATGNMVLTSVYNKAIDYGIPSANKSITYYVDTLSGLFYMTIDSIKDISNVVRCTISNSLFKLDKTGQIGFSDEALKYNIEYLYIPSSLDGVSINSISNSGFKNCKSLKYVFIHPAIKNYGSSAFENCVNLKMEMEISSSIISIGGNAFKNSGITFTSIDLTGVTKSSAVGVNAFTGTTVKKLIVGESGVKSYDSSNKETYPFYNVKGFETLEYKTGTTTAKNVLSDSMRKTIESAILPTSITKIDNYTFENCVNFNSIKIPRNLTFIGSSAFENCTNLKSEMEISSS
ncbi:MAG TPA: hypothetical protein DDW20_03825, partial [Firmicutes bacterium]|nr:hypothetical protein [Bacillota bacterium]